MTEDCNMIVRILPDDCTTVRILSDDCMMIINLVKIDFKTFVDCSKNDHKMILKWLVKIKWGNTNLKVR